MFIQVLILKIQVCSSLSKRHQSYMFYSLSIQSWEMYLGGFLGVQVTSHEKGAIIQLCFTRRAQKPCLDHTWLHIHDHYNLHLSNHIITIPWKIKGNTLSAWENWYWIQEILKDLQEYHAPNFIMLSNYKQSSIWRKKKK